MVFNKVILHYSVIDINEPFDGIRHIGVSGLKGW